jgi:hypothetical protein
VSAQPKRGAKGCQSQIAENALAAFAVDGWPKAAVTGHWEATVVRHRVDVVKRPTDCRYSGLYWPRYRHHSAGAENLQG